MRHGRRVGGTGHLLPGVLLLVAGVLIAFGAPGIWSLTHQDPALRPIDPGIAVSLAGDGARRSATDEPVTASTSSTPRPTPTPPVTTSKTVSSATVGAMTRVPTVKTPAPSTTRQVPGPPAIRPLGVPIRLRIPAIGVDAPVEAVGVDDQGDMAVPEQVTQTGWYKFGPVPGARSGSVVISGHIDSASQGLGAFHALGDLEAGDAVLLADAAGRQQRYRVVGREAFDKRTVPLSKLFSRTGSARLTLITCGGGFDSRAHSYLDNIVVTAVPS